MSSAFFRQHGVIVPADDGFVAPPTGIGAEVGDAGANIGVRLIQLRGNVRLLLPDQLDEHCLHGIVPFVVLVKDDVGMQLGRADIEVFDG